MAQDRKYRLRFFISRGFSQFYLWAGDDPARGGTGIVPIQDLLPLSDTLRKRGNELANWYQQSLNRSNPSDPGPWRQAECDRFKLAARAFFEDLKTELGEQYVLVYEQAEPDEDPDLDEYLKDPQYFRRKPE